MAGERTLPGMGLTGFYNLGSDGWKAGMDTNLQTLSAVTQLTVISRVAVVPGSPTNGDMHILTGAPNAQTVALYDNGAWYYLTPKAGWVAYSALDDEHFKYTGLVWILFNAFTNVTVDYLTFNLAAAHLVATGEIAWNANDGTFDAGLNNGVVLQMGQEMHIHAKAAETLSDSEVVYASGAVGASGKIEVSKFIADNSIDELYMLGVATQDIASGGFGYITTFGAVRGVPTDGAAESETWVDGTVLYASPTVAGQFTNVKPVAPNLAISVAMVVHAHASNGTLYVRPSRGFHIDELHDVDAPTPNDGEGLFWDAGNSKYVNGAPIVAASGVVAARITGSTYSTAQHMQDVFHSTGITDDTMTHITDDADGTITVAASSGLIRATDSDVAELLFTDWAAESGANVALVDNTNNYIYVEYNAGSPQVIATAVKRTDYNTNIVLGTVYRAGTTLHITDSTMIHVSNHAGLMIRRAFAVDPYAHESGGFISEKAGRTFAITSGKFWHGLSEITVAAMDTSVADTYRAFYQDGIGGWTEIAAQTAINNTQYDDGDGTLGTLDNNKYGVHWVFRESDGDTVVVFGRGSYSLIEAEAATVPTNLPPEFEAHARIFGKIIVQKSATSFTGVESAFDTVFVGGAATDHEDLINKGTLTHAEIDAILTPLDQGLATTDDVEFASLIVDTDTFVVDKVNGRVGVKTTNPATQFETNGVVRSTRVGAASQYVDIDGGNGTRGGLDFVSGNKALEIRVLDSGATGTGGLLFKGGTIATPFEFLRLDGTSRAILPGTTEAQDLGSPLKEWDNLYLQNAATVSDERRKENIATIDDASSFLRLVDPVWFTYNDKVIPAETKTVERQVTITKQREEKSVEIIDGKPVQVVKMVDYEEPQFEMLAVADEAGKPVLHEVEIGKGKDGKPIFEMQALLHRVPVMETVTETTPEQTITHSRPHTGFIAQKIKQAMTDSDYDDWSGYAYDEESDTHMLRLMEMIAFTVKGWQELDDRLTALEPPKEAGHNP